MLDVLKIYFFYCTEIYYCTIFYNSIFSRAVSTSGATYLVTMASVCMSGCLSVHLYLTEGPPPPSPGNHRISKIPKPKCVSAHCEQLFRRGGPPPPPVKGKIFDTRFGLIHVQTGKKIFPKKFFGKFFLQNFTPIS